MTPSVQDPGYSPLPPRRNAPGYPVRAPDASQSAVDMQGIEPVLHAIADGGDDCHEPVPSYCVVVRSSLLVSYCRAVACAAGQGQNTDPFL